ncbi:hypothetical protein B0H17DRAFT_962570, partial [Mycena rosella]
LDFESLVSKEDYAHLMNFMYIDSAEKIDEFSEFVRGLGVKKIQDWWDHKEMSAWILPCLIKSQSPMSAEDWDNTAATTNTGEAQHHWTRTQTGSKLSLVEAIETARKLDERVAREIEISIKHGVLVNSNNEPYHRRALNTMRTSTTVRKSRESDERAEKRARIELEIQAEKEGSAARLKVLKERKSATGKAPRTCKASKSSGSRTFFVSASSSGRVVTKTFSNVLIFSTAA